jgi:outer membrane protein assembly factor BamB
VSGNKVYVTVGFGAGCHLFDITVAGGKFKAEDKYKKAVTKKVKSTFGGMVLIDGYLYGHSERDMWVCQDFKTGALKWETDVDVKGASGGITAAEGKLYLFSDDGEVGLVDADPGEFKLISSFKLPMRSALSKGRVTSRMAKVWTYPVIANGRLYLRDNEFIFAYELK